MVKYIWQREGWPNFTFENSVLMKSLARCRRLQGELIYKIYKMGPTLAKEVESKMLVNEALRTSEIEGAQVNSDSVRSSVARRLGLPIAGLPNPGRYEEGVVEMLLDATRRHFSPLNKERLFSWHAGLFPVQHTRLGDVSVGQWRKPEKDPMQIVSGRADRPNVHFEAPPASSVPSEMEKFFRWFEEGSSDTDGLIRAGIAHLWFVTIHPFEDGNGRIARAITDLAMAQDDRSVLRAYSLSNQIQSSAKEKSAYYDILESTQKGDGQIDNWLSWFTGLVERSLKNSSEMLRGTLAKAEFWSEFSQVDLNDRQRKVINRLLDVGPDGLREA